MKNAFVTLGDVSANVNVASLLTKFNRSFDLRSGEDVAFGDLRQSPAVLIGAFNNGWTLQMTGDLPFVFDIDLTIRDRSDTTRRMASGPFAGRTRPVGLRAGCPPPSFENRRTPHRDRRCHSMRNASRRRVHHLRTSTQRSAQVRAKRLGIKEHGIRSPDEGDKRYSDQSHRGRNPVLVDSLGVPGVLLVCLDY